MLNQKVASRGTARWLRKGGVRVRQEGQTLQSVKAKRKPSQQEEGGRLEGCSKPKEATQFPAADTEPGGQETVPRRLLPATPREGKAEVRAP